MDRAQPIQQRLIAHVPASERARFGRTLASLEAHHRNELHAALCTSFEAENALALCRTEASVAAHAAAAKEAKLRCAVEEQRSEKARLEQLLEQALWRAQQDTTLSSSVVARAWVSKEALTFELQSVESQHAEARSLLSQLHHAAHHRGEHLGAVQQQSVRSTQLLVQMQEQLLTLQKRLSQQQRRTARVQEQLQTAEASARSWAVERVRLRQAVGCAEETANLADERAERLMAQHEATSREAVQEREASAEAISSSRMAYRAQEVNQQAKLERLQALVGALSADQSKVALKSGGGCTIGQYVRALQERLGRRTG